jgi:hypothetical protein
LSFHFACNALVKDGTRLKRARKEFLLICSYSLTRVDGPMDNPPESGARFIGTIELLADGWRASFGMRVPGDVFTQPGETEFFATELQATKWLHAEAAARGFSSVELRRER